MDSLPICKAFMKSTKERNFYEVINKILSLPNQPFCTKEEIKSAIEGALNGDDYIFAVIDYLWQGYSKGDPRAKAAFKKIFFDDLKAGNPEAFYFFSSYFMNDIRRRGFDRRTDGSDRRTSYSLDFFSGILIERRTGNERRREPEKRCSWTRITKWVSVPSNAGTEQQSPPLCLFFAAGAPDWQD